MHVSYNNSNMCRSSFPRRRGGGIAFSHRFTILPFFFTFVTFPQTKSFCFKAPMDSGGWDACCPVCITPYSEQDKQFRPCACAFRMCLWCWHTIVTMAQSDYQEALCPGCRAPFDVETIQRQHSRPVKPKSTRRAAPGRAHLADVVLNDKRVVAVRNIPSVLIDIDAEGDERGEEAPDTVAARQCDARLFAIGQHFLFGQYGRIVGAVVVKVAAGLHRMPTYSAAIRYASSEEAARCVRFAHNSVLLGHTLSCKLVPTRYCGQFLLKSLCTKRMCVELHSEHKDKALHIKPPPAVFSVLGGAEGIMGESQPRAADGESVAVSMSRETRRLATEWSTSFSAACSRDIKEALATEHLSCEDSSHRRFTEPQTPFSVGQTPLTSLQQSFFETSQPKSSSVLEVSSHAPKPSALGDLQLRARVAIETQRWLAASSADTAVEPVSVSTNALMAIIGAIPPHTPAVAVHCALPHPTMPLSKGKHTPDKRQTSS